MKNIKSIGFFFLFVTLFIGMSSVASSSPGLNFNWTVTATGVEIWTAYPDRSFTFTVKGAVTETFDKEATVELLDPTYYYRDPPPTPTITFTLSPNYDYINFDCNLSGNDTFTITGPSVSISRSYSAPCRYGGESVNANAGDTYTAEITYESGKGSNAKIGYVDRTSVLREAHSGPHAATVNELEGSKTIGTYTPTPTQQTNWNTVMGSTTYSLTDVSKPDDVTLVIDSTIGTVTASTTYSETSTYTSSAISSQQGSVDEDYVGSYSITLTPQHGGTISNIDATVSDDNDLVETSITKNIAGNTISGEVRGRLLKPDLTLSGSDIFFDPENPLEGQRVIITAYVANIGEAQANYVKARFYDGDPDAGGTLIGEYADAVPLPPNIARMTQVWDWDTTGKVGNRNIYVKIDPDNKIAESNENNNKANKVINIRTIPCNSTIRTNINLSYDITGCPDNGLIIGASNIVLDCAGHKISGINNKAGISNRGFNNVTIKNCDISNFHVGVYLDSASNNKIRDNTISNSKVAIQLYRSSNNNILTGNTIVNNSWSGVWLYYQASNNKIANNKIDNSYIGVYFITANQNFIHYNIITNNNYRGIYLASSLNNSIINNVVDNNNMGIFTSWSPNNVITNNTFNSNQHHGIFFTQSSDNNLLANNIINNNIERGVFFADSSNNKITNSTITNNQYGIYLFSSGINSIWHNNIYNNSYNNVFSDQPIELSYNNEGNYWGHDCNAAFTAGVDSNRNDVIDSYPYGAENGWLIGGPC